MAGATTTGKSPGKPPVNCARCGGHATWEKPWQTYMHWGEENEDSHAVGVPGATA